MSKTYKHQAKYDQKIYWSNYRGFGWAEPIFVDNQKVGWRTMPPAKKQKEPHPWYWHGVEANNKQEIEKILQRRFRHKVKRLIHNGEYDLLPLRPERSDWVIY